MLELKRKAINLFIPILIVILLLPFTNVNSQLEIGGTLDYKIIKSRIHAEVGEDFVETKKLSFGSLSVAEGTKITALINFFDEGMNGEFTIKNTTRFFGYGSDNFKSAIERFIFRTTYFSYSLASNWENQDFDNGFYFYLYPYIQPVPVYLSFLENIDLYLISNLNPYIGNSGYDLHNETTISIEGNELLVETWNGGVINSSDGFLYGFTEDIPANFSFGNQFQIAIDRSNGLCLGLRFRGWSSGTINNKSVEISIDYKYEKVRYNLPNFELGNYMDFFSKKVYYALLTLIIPIVTVPTILIVRRKKVK